MVSHVLDANVFHHCSSGLLSSRPCAAVWDWLDAQATAGAIKVPLPIWDEIERVYNPLRDWQHAHKSTFLIEDAGADARVGGMLDLYAPDLTEEEMLRIGADPFLAAYAQEFGAKVVTKEVSKPTCQRANKRLPDICTQCRVPWITDHILIRELDFKT